MKFIRKNLIHDMYMMMINLTQHSLGYNKNRRDENSIAIYKLGNN